MFQTKPMALNVNTIKGNKQKHKINLRNSLLTSTKHESHKRSVYFYFLVMAQYFVVLLIFFISGESFGTTTSPQQQNIQQTKDLCEVRDNCLALDDSFGLHGQCVKHCMKNIHYLLSTFSHPLENVSSLNIQRSSLRIVKHP